MAQFGWQFGRMQTDDTKNDESGTFALHTLGENETIARLATGVKRFELPDEFNFIKIYQQIAAEPKTGYAMEALEQLAQIFENRRQYPKAADYWQRLLKEFPAADINRRQGWKDRLDQIVGNWGRFEPVSTQPAGKGATVEFRFRNGTAVDFTAHEIKVEKLLDDVKAFLKSSPREINWEKIDIGNIGYRLVEKNQKQYLGRQVAQWQMDLKPRENHFDKPDHRHHAAVEARGVSGRSQDGGRQHQLHRPLGRRHGHRQKAAWTARRITSWPTPSPASRWPRPTSSSSAGSRDSIKNGRPEVLVKNFAEFTDADGQVILDPKRQPQDYQWLIIARTTEGRFAYLGFTSVW